MAVWAKCVKRGKRVKIDFPAAKKIEVKAEKLWEKGNVNQWIIIQLENSENFRRKLALFRSKILVVFSPSSLVLPYVCDLTSARRRELKRHVPSDDSIVMSQWVVHLFVSRERGLMLRQGILYCESAEMDVSGGNFWKSQKKRKNRKKVGQAKKAKETLRALLRIRRKP